MSNQKNDLAKIRRQAEEQGWRVTRGKRYYMLRCPCEEKHWKTMKLTPDRDYVQNLVGQLKRATCWDDGEAK